MPPWGLQSLCSDAPLSREVCSFACELFAKRELRLKRESLPAISLEVRAGRELS